MNKQARAPETSHDRAKRLAGFTLLEMLVAITILCLICVILASILEYTSNIWQQGEVDNQNRRRARIALERIGQELRAATLPLNRTSQTSLEFIVNPSSIGSNYLNRDAIFWQAPIATDTSQGDLAEVGYFVRYVNNQPVLCRFFVNPSGSNYIESNPTGWLSASILDSVAPATQASQYQGLFLQNVLGLWIQAFNQDGTAYGGDSRVSGTLPAWVDLTLVLIDSEHARRLTSPGHPGSYSTASMFIASLPNAVSSGLSIVTMRVCLANETNWVSP